MTKLMKLDVYTSDGLLCKLADLRARMLAETNGHALVMLQLMLDEVTDEIHQRNRVVLLERAAVQGAS